MNEPAAVHRKNARRGWALVLLVSALMILNGASWYFVGPTRSTDSMAENLGTTPAEFLQAYPDAATVVQATAKLVATWFTAFGLFALLVALDGYRNGGRGVWAAAWTLPAALVAVGALEGSGFGIALLVLAGLAAAGLWIARLDAAKRTS